MSSSDGTRRSERPANLAHDACEHYHAGLHRFLMQRLRSAHNAQDLAQETYLRLLRVDRSEFVRKPRAYLYRIAANLIYEFRLRERRDPVTFDSEMVEQTDELPGSGSAEDVSERFCQAQELEALLAPLPPLYRAAFVLRKRDGLSYPEIARTLGISVHTVKKYLARAVAHFRAAVRDR